MKFINEMDSYFVVNKKSSSNNLFANNAISNILHHEEYDLEGYSYSNDDFNNLADAGVKLYTESLYDYLARISKRFTKIHKYLLKSKQPEKYYYQIYELSSKDGKESVAIAMLGNIFKNVFYAVHPASGTKEHNLLSRVSLNVYDVVVNGIDVPLNWDNKLCILAPFGAFISFPLIKNGESLYGGRPKDMVFETLLQSIEMTRMSLLMFEKFHIGRMMEKSLSMKNSKRDLYCYSNMSQMITSLNSIEDSDTKKNLLLHSRYTKHIKLFDNDEEPSESSRIHEHSFLVNPTLDENELKRFVYYEIDWGHKVELVASLGDQINSILEKIDLSEFASKMPTFYKAYNNATFADSEKGVLIIGSFKTVFKYEIADFSSTDEKSKKISDFEYTLKTLFIELRNIIDYIESRDNKEEKKGNESFKRMVGFQLLSRVFMNI